MRTTHSLTVSRSICHARPPAMHAPHRAWPPFHACPLPCMPPPPGTPPVDRILDTRFWKYYLVLTSLRAVIKTKYISPEPVGVKFEIKAWSSRLVKDWFLVRRNWIVKSTLSGWITHRSIDEYTNPEEVPFLSLSASPTHFHDQLLTLVTSMQWRIHNFLDVGRQPTTGRERLIRTRLIRSST